MPRTAARLVGLALVFAGGLAVAGRPPAPPPIPAALRGKLQEKLDLARRLYDESNAEVERGLVEVGDLLGPSQLLLSAELPFCATPAEQLKAHQRHLAVLKRAEEHFQRRFQQRRIPFQTYAQVQLARLDEEIAILQLQTRLPPPKPTP